MKDQLTIACGALLEMPGGRGAYFGGGEGWKFGWGPGGADGLAP